MDNAYAMADLIQAYKNSDPVPETQDILLYYLSELTGKSPDAILELIRDTD